jgi:hypothetical protein
MNNRTDDFSVRAGAFYVGLGLKHANTVNRAPPLCGLCLSYNMTTTEQVRKKIGNAFICRSWPDATRKCLIYIYSVAFKCCHLINMYVESEIEKYEC